MLSSLCSPPVSQPLHANAHHHHPLLHPPLPFLSLPRLMAEWVPPKPPMAGPHNPTDQDPDEQPGQLIGGAGTYVVQVPKDQIYRVPPPENAHLVAKYRNKTGNGKKKQGSTCICCVFSFTAPVLLLLLLSGVIFYFLVRPALPTFAIERLLIKSHPSPEAQEYEFKLRTKNPSAGLAFSYERSGGGKAVLAYREVDVAAARATPGFYNGYEQTSKFDLVLRGYKIGMAREMERSLNGSKKIVPLSVSVEMPLRMKVGGMEIMWAMRMDVDCDVKVRGLAKGKTRVVSQECGVKIRT